MPDPRWSAQEIAARFSSIDSNVGMLRDILRSYSTSLSVMNEKIEVLESRVLELEETLDDAP